ncbi:hypothetical protein DFS33DRAFT_918594 [Desarmillaria ectypa]|nr:hypothetical protein DFS33DRAFT_918594 [Desarmillaria ectypa]
MYISCMFCCLHNGLLLTVVDAPVRYFLTRISRGHKTCISFNSAFIVFSYNWTCTELLLLKNDVVPSRERRCATLAKPSRTS